MRDFRDKEWDERYNNFKLYKEKRKQMEASKAGTQSQPQIQPSNSITRRHVGQKTEARVFVNKGPSRFLKEHSQQRSTQTQNQVQVSRPVTVEEPKTQNEIVIEESAPMTQIKFNFMDILPYLFMVFGIIVIVLILTGVIKL